MWRGLGTEGFPTCAAVCLEFYCKGVTGSWHLGRWSQQQRERETVGGDSAQGGGKGGLAGEMGGPQSKTYLPQISPRANKNF